MRHKWVQVFFLLGFFVRWVGAQTVSVGGYFEPQLMGISLKNHFYLLQSNKLRVDLNSDVTEKVSFAANFDFIRYNGKTHWNALDYLPESLTKTIPSIFRQAFRFSYKDSIFLDNAFVRFSFRYADLTVGRQQISLGTGYAWNPTDVFNMKNLIDPTYEQPGHNAIRLDIPLGTRYTVVALAAPGDDFKTSGKLLRFKGRLGHFDYSLIGIETQWRFTDFRRFHSTPETRRLLGADFAGQILGIGVWGEWASNWMKQNGNFTEAVLGADYTFNNGLYILAEGFHTTLGKKNYQNYTLSDWMQFLMGQKKALARDQVYLFSSYPATDFVTLGFSAVASLSDGSVALIPMVTDNVFENVELTLFGNFYRGKEGTAYASNLGNGGMVRLRVYF